jgi:hypothetical protein
MNLELRFASIALFAMAAVFSAAAEPGDPSRFSFLAESKHPESASRPDISSAPVPFPRLALHAGSGSSAPVPAYSPLHGVYGSMIGLGMGMFVGVAVMAPSMSACKERSNSGSSDPDSDSGYGSLCSLGGLLGMAIGGPIGYSLGVPVGGHISQGLLTRKFAINIAAITVLTGVLAYTDWRLFEAYGDPSCKVTIPLSVVAPHLAAYLIGR